MGTVTVQIPQSGEPDRTAELKVSNALQTIVAALNGGVDAANIKDGSIGLAELSAAAQSAMGSPPQVVALPTNPTDGQEVYLLASTNLGVQWHMRYRQASTSTYRWECVGGVPYTMEAPGDYIISFGCFAFMSAVAQSTRISVGASNLSPAGVYAEFVQPLTVASAGASISRTIRAGGISGTLSSQVNLNVLSGYVDRRWISVMPVRMAGATS
jgi:hypothetical protein